MLRLPIPLLIPAATVLIAACGSGETPPAASIDASVETACVPQRPVETLAERASPYDSVKITIGGGTAQICYGRPYTKGRTIFAEPGEGVLVPFGQLWRTGANEPTILHLPFAATIAGLEVPAGSYSIYTIPARGEWTVIVNGSISQWGIESQYAGTVAAEEVGRAVGPAEMLEAPVEQFTIRAEPAGPRAADIVLEWERTRVRIPLVAQ